MFRLGKVSTLFAWHCFRLYNKTVENMQNIAQYKFKAHNKNVLLMKACYKMNNYIDMYFQSYKIFVRV